MRYAIDKEGTRWNHCGVGVVNINGMEAKFTPFKICDVERRFGPLTWHDDEPEKTIAPEPDKPAVYAIDRDGRRWNLNVVGTCLRIDQSDGIKFGDIWWAAENFGPLKWYAEQSGRKENSEPDQTNYAGGTEADWSKAAGDDKPQPTEVWDVMVNGAAREFYVTRALNGGEVFEAFPVRNNPWFFGINEFLKRKSR